MSDDIETPKGYKEFGDELFRYARKKYPEIEWSDKAVRPYDRYVLYVSGKKDDNIVGYVPTMTEFRFDRRNGMSVRASAKRIIDRMAGDLTARDA